MRRVHCLVLVFICCAAGLSACGAPTDSGSQAPAAVTGDFTVETDVLEQTVEGEPLRVYTLRNGDMEAQISTYGATSISAARGRGTFSTSS